MAKIPELSARAVRKAADDDTEVQSEVHQRAEAVRDYWQSIAPVGETGNYRDSIHLEPNRGGIQVIADDQKAHWIEFGAMHMPEYAPAQQTAEHFSGDGVIASGALADNKVMTAQGKYRVAAARHAEHGSVETHEAMQRAKRARSQAFRDRRKR